MWESSVGNTTAKAKIATADKISKNFFIGF
jgi:hypothetical protein